VGDIVGDRYRLVEVLGFGASGVVFRAVHTRLNKNYAVKVIRSDDPEWVARFQREAQALAMVQHPNVCDVSDFGRTSAPGGFYLAMEFLRGDDLLSIVNADAPLSPERITRLFVQLLRGLGACHDAGIVHRDLKPENVMVTAGEVEHVTLVDFGIAAFHGAIAQGLSRLTNINVAMGTPHFMAPEQAKGEPTDGRADLYSVGIMLYEALTGCLPFDEEQAADVMYAQVFTPPPTLSENAADLPHVGAYQKILDRLLAKLPEDRYSHADEVARALASVTHPRPTSSFLNMRERWFSA